MSRYRVSFRAPYDPEGTQIEKAPYDPETASSEVGPNGAVTAEVNDDGPVLDIADGVVQQSSFVEASPPGEIPVQGDVDADELGLNMASEVWEFEIAPGREQEFQFVLTNDDRVVSYERIEQTA